MSKHVIRGFTIEVSPSGRKIRPNKHKHEAARRIREDGLSPREIAAESQIGTWKRAAIENMATAFTRKGSTPEPVRTYDIAKLHSKIGPLVVEQDFLPDTSHQLLGTRGKRWRAAIIS